MPTVGAEFVWRMEAILDLYARADNPRRPRVCIDELPYQLVGEARAPRPVQAGRPQRYDYEYRRHGTCNLFVAFRPERGWRHVQVTARRTKVDFAYFLRDLVDVHFPDAEVIDVVVDNLNTHSPASLYEAFAPEEAHRIARKLVFHHTPKHGSWLNMAEIEISVLSEQCLDRRIPDIATLEREVAAWQKERNERGATIDWRFTTALAREKLKCLYPSKP
jgi:hypothetical protein